MSGVSKTPKITSRVLTGPEFCPDQSHAFLTPTRTTSCKRAQSDGTVPQSNRDANNATYHHAHLRTNASEPPKNMGWHHRVGAQYRPFHDHVLRQDVVHVGGRHLQSVGVAGYRELSIQDDLGRLGLYVRSVVVGGAL